MQDKSKKSAIVSASSSTDLHLVLLWLKSNDGISSSGKIYKTKNGYATKVKSKVSKKKLRYLAKERFGVFANVR